ncbi:MAG: ABC transporter ATP-binding protein [Firmicutes bacterium]|nr:ABC transporter ATP-binding protein [Bacillota bacterium]
MAQAEWAIEVDHVSKAFRVHTEKNPTLKEKVIYARRAKHREFVALRDVSMTIGKGTTVGLLGVNGSGKSTLLKLISRILYPDTGSIHVRGKVSSLLELGAGFHPDFTGTENIFLNGSLMGLSKKEIQYKLDEIIDFSELGDFIREPIRSYSSGMYMRLAFSVAVAVDPEILLIDEILAVGDAAFQAKCMDRLRKLQSQNRTIVIVTHDTGAVERFCDRAVWLHNSRMVLDGDPSDCVQRYLQEAFQNASEGANVMSFDRVDESSTDLSHVAAGDAVAATSAQEDAAGERVGGHEVVLTTVAAHSEMGTDIVRAGMPLQVVLQATCRVDKANVVFGVHIETEDGVLLYGTDTRIDLTGPRSFVAGEQWQVSLQFEQLALAPGHYALSARVFTEAGEPLDIWPQCAHLTVVSEPREVGYMHMAHTWTFEPKGVKV